MHDLPDEVHVVRQTSGGLVLICDIIDFSELTPPRQADAVARLWRFLQEDRIFPRLKPGGAEFNGTGDGFVIADFGPSLQPRELVDFSCRLLTSLKAVKHQVRVGLHVGQILAIDVMSDRPPELVGAAINQCARIVPFAAPGELVVSEQFRLQWEQVEPDLRDLFKPPRTGKGPLGIYVKHEREMGIRRYEGCSPKKSPASRRVESLLGIVRLIRETMADIQSQVDSALCGLDPALTPEVLSSRVSILAPQKVDGQRRLCSNVFRHSHKERHTDPGRTNYRIDPKPQGPAVCFKNGKPSILVGLPDYADSPKEYVKEVSEKWSVTKQQVADWQCHARAFISFPFGMFDFSNSEPEGVVCIDLMAPLEGVPAEDLTSVAAYLQEYGFSRLAPLWRLRTSP